MLVFIKQDFAAISEDFRNKLQNIKNMPSGWKVLSALLFLWIAILSCLTLSTGPIGDAEACYMALPKLFAIKGKIFHSPFYMKIVQYGFWVETHYMMLYLLGGLTAVKVFILTFAAPCGYFTARIAQSCGANYRGIIITLIMVFTSTVSWRNFLSAKTDAIVCAVGMVAYFWLIVSADKDPSKRMFLTGIRIASAILAKISYIPILGISVFC